MRWLWLATVALAQVQGQQQVHVVGAAEVLPDRLRLTPAVRQVAGAAWFSPKQRVISGFEVTFRFQLSELGGLGPGADGFAFVMQNQGLTALAGRGASGGFAFGDGYGDPSSPGIPDSVAVFFDTFKNPHDPSDNYVAICTNGPLRAMKWPPPQLGIGKKLKFRLKDRRIHTARIVYEPPLLSVFLDDGPATVRVPVDLSTVADASGYSYVGMTASTGSGWENHDIFDWTFTPKTATSSDMFVVQSDLQLRTDCLEGRNLCTPAKAVVDEVSPGQFHIVLPGRLAWGASIPNPEKLPISITNAKGTVCRAAANGEIDTCSGPAGVLIQKQERGRTWFSMSGAGSPGFEQNQGYFEFDVRVSTLP